MKEDQEQKCHICRFCKQGFSNGKKLGGHMRRHLALISASRKMGIQETINVQKGVHVSDDYNDDDDTNGRKQSTQENDQEIIDGRKQSMQETINGERGLDFDDSDDVAVKKSQQEIDVDQDYKANAYVLRENPKRSWRVTNSNSNSSSSKGFQSAKALATTHKRCDSRKESVKHSVCEKCGKNFNSLKALYGHMRCHSIRRSRPFDVSSLMSSSEDHHHQDDDEVATPVRKKRSCTRYKSPKPNHHCGSSLSSSDDEVEKGAICLMMLSMGVRSLDEVKLVISNQAEFGFSDSRYMKVLQTDVEFEVSVDGSMELCELKKDLIVRSGSGQLNPGRAGSTPVKYKSPKKPRSCDQDFGEMDATDSSISLGLKRVSKGHNCPDYFKEFGSGQLKPGRAGSNPLKCKSPKKPRSCDQDFGEMDANDSGISLGLKRVLSKGHHCPDYFKEFGSGRALGCHKRVHTSTGRKVTENNQISDVLLTF